MVENARACLPAILEVKGSNPGPGKINLIKKKH
jgi:hypothetical protein